MVAALGIDVGSTNVKTVLVDDEGRASGGATRPLLTHRDGDVAEQDPEALWEAVSEAVRETTSSVSGRPAAVVCASQYSSIVPVDAHGRSVGPLVMYWDQRGGDDVLSLLGAEAAFETWLDRHGIPPVGPGFSLAHMLHFEHDRPEVHAATASYLEPMDFVNLRLTGRVAATQGTMFTSLLCDNRKLGGTDYDPDLVRLSGVDAERLPPLVAADAVVGEVLPEVAASLGLPAGIPVFAGVNDSHSCALAAGVARPDRGAVVIGTTSVMLDTIDHKKATDFDHAVLPMPGPLGDYLVWAENGIGGKALEHVLESVVHAADGFGDHSTPDAFANLDGVLAAVEPGSGRLLFLPWLEGSMSPDANARMRGGWLNLGLDTGRAHMVRAAVEGISFNLRWLLPAVEAFSGHNLTEIVFAGGAARSPVWAQILADVLDRPVSPLVDAERVAARGAALLALVRLGALSEADVVAGVATTATYEPRRENRAIYDLMFTQFVRAFEQNRPIFEELNQT